MKPTEGLTAEHDVIKRAIALLEEANRRLENGDDSVADIYPQLVDFIREFADACHHGKEEDILFTLLKERGLPPQGPLEVMMIEHDRGRSYVKGLAEAANKFRHGNKAARDDIVNNAAGYAELLKGHIHKEDFVLYPMADKILSDADQRKLEQEFEQVEENFGRGRHHRYEEMIGELEGRLEAS